MQMHNTTHGYLLALWRWLWKRDGTMHFMALTGWACWLGAEWYTRGFVTWLVWPLLACGLIMLDWFFSERDARRARA